MRSDSSTLAGSEPSRSPSPPPASVLAFCPPAALVAALPAIASVTQGPAPAGAGVIVWGMMTLVLGALTTSFRAAWLMRAPWWLWVAPFLAVAPFAAVVAGTKEATHHRPLGAATVAALGAALYLVALVLVHRTVKAANRRPSLATTVAKSTALAAAVIGGLGAAGVALAMGEGGSRSLVIHGVLVFGLAAALGRGRGLPSMRPTWSLGLFAGPPAAAITVAIMDPASRVAAVRVAPWLAVLGLG
ncbi:MAG: hypothetical protein JW751_31080 [Polyangiaceae bacterium]|nr:hypothetical protein [Polyangiaceae bacterium]